MLRNVATVVDAVTEAVAFLENSGLFNAGAGASCGFVDGKTHKVNCLVNRQIQELMKSDDFPANP